MANTLAKIIHIGHKFIHSAEYKRVWGFLDFPHRPTEEEIETYRIYLEKHLVPETRCLVLGATPELRDLFSRFGVKPVLADIAHSMFTDMLHYTKHARQENETWIKENWLNLFLPEHSLDCVVGDLSLRHIAPDEQKLLFKKICKFLRPGGVFVVRHHIINPSYQGRAYSSILEEMKDADFSAQKYGSMGILLSRLLDNSTESSRVNLAAITGAVNHYLATEKVSLAYGIFLYEFLEKRIYRFGKILTSQTEQEIAGAFKRYFTIISKKYTGTYPESEHYPIYMLKPLP